jgi:hypothetical protein
MRRSTIHIPYREITKRLTPLVRGRVLHITCAANLPSILSDGAISGNADGRWASSFGSSRNGFFRVRNAVSVFDYRSVSDDEFEDAWMKCGPHRALSQCNYRIALLFLASESYKRLISWKLWAKEEAWEQMLVPHVEAGYPAPLPVSDIEEILELRTRYYPSRLERALWAARVRSPKQET